MNTAITIFQHKDSWEVQWIGKDGDNRSETLPNFEAVSRFVEGTLLAND